MTAARAPAQRIATVPVGAAYFNVLGLIPSASPILASVVRTPARCACRRTAISSARRRPFSLSGSLPSEKSAKSCLGTTYVL